MFRLLLLISFLLLEQDVVAATVVFSDDFERTSLGSDWSTTNSSRSGTTTSRSSSGSRSMYTRNGVVTVTSKVIDLSTATSGNLSYWVGVDGSLIGLFGSAPNPGEDLKVEILLSTGNWQQVSLYVSNSTIFSLFDLFGSYFSYNAALPSNALHSGFRIRYTMLGGGVSLFDLLGDYWYIDNITVSMTAYVPPAVDHFRLSYGSSALTCNPTEVTIQACEDASCSTLYTGSVDVTLSPTGWVGGDTITVTGGSATASLAHTSVGTVTLGVSSSVPAATGSGTQCSIDGGAYSSSCDLTFADSGFLVDVPDFLSARGETATISAVKKSDNSLQCTPAFANKTKTVSLWSDYVLPSSGSMAVSVASSAIGTTSGTATTQSLTFDASGQATAAINYSDAGNMRLQVKYTGSGADSGLVMTGNGEFIARPAGMCVQASGVCSSDYSNCSAFKKAGENFDLTTTAVAWESDGDSNFCSGNAGTPNYSATAISLASSVVSPAGQRDGTVTPTSYDHTAASGGANTVSINESEVGVFNFNVTPPLYQGAALGSLSSTSLVTYSSGPTGRFIPDHFEIAEVTPGRLAATCSTGNLYSGETTTWAEAPEYTFTAHNVGHGITTNYTETGYTKLTAANVFSGIIEPTTDGSQDGTDNNKLAVSLTSNQGSLNIAATDSGVMNYVFSALDDVTYQRSAVAEVAPFIPDLDFSFPTTIADSDGVAVSSLVNFSPDTSAISLRFGRIWLEDGYGPETENLILPLRAEYFDGTGYLINILDDCSGWDDANASADTLTALMTSTGTLVGGSSNADGLLLQAPTTVAGTPDTGKAIITLTVPSWLQGDYDNNGFYEDPKGIASFGIWRGHQRVIYRRELH
ncbi:MAG: MSHA biogenesis protein MshQ [Gammaproteobacteria bacterium]